MRERGRRGKSAHAVPAHRSAKGRGRAKLYGSPPFPVLKNSVGRRKGRKGKGELFSYRPSHRRKGPEGAGEENRWFILASPSVLPFTRSLPFEERATKREKKRGAGPAHHLLPWEIRRDQQKKGGGAPGTPPPKKQHFLLWGGGKKKKKFFGKKPSRSPMEEKGEEVERSPTHSLSSPPPFVFLNRVFTKI